MMEQNESKAPLILMEQVIMVLVFALVSAVCLQAFALARTTSVQMSERDHAVNVSQILAETLKACGGSMEEAGQRLGAESDGDQLVLYYDGEWKEAVGPEDASFLMTFMPEESDGFCRYGKIAVSDASDDQEIFSMRVAWQGEDANE